MVATSFIVQLALLPCLVLGSSLSPRAKEFDYDSLTLREVGARNTLVSRLQWLMEMSLSYAGLACLAGEGWAAYFLLA